MANPRPIPHKSQPAPATLHARAQSLIGVVGLLAGMLAGLHLAACAPIGRAVPPSEAQSPVSAQATDPTRSIYFSWDPIDRAVTEGAIEFLVVATPIGVPEPRERRYRLLGPRDQPGELTIRRTEDDGAFTPGTRPMTVTARIGRFGEPDLEAAVVNEIVRRLKEASDQAAG